ncbi:MAG TPA: TIGR00725 family protein [bacterium]|nr:TIGR00725 family protein [bacterium]
MKKAAAKRRPVIAVCGAGAAGPELDELAARVGEAIAEAGAVLVCGGLGGVMEAAARGAREAGGLTIGILPGSDTGEANAWIEAAVATDMGPARNAIIVATADAVVAVGGGYGTLSEIALALKMGKPVVSIGSWEVSGDVLKAAGPAEAVEMALNRIRVERR